MENMYKAAGGIGDVMVDIASPSPAYMSGKIDNNGFGLDRFLLCFMM